MKKTMLLLCLLVGIVSMKAQNEAVLNTLYDQMETVLSAEDEALLRACPVLRLNAQQMARPLPAAVDNSRTPYMTPIYGQSALECGQASSIVYTFSYETDLYRGVANNSESRRYPSHFAWNFCNGGKSRGVSFMDTWEVIRTAGTPNVSDWGGWYSTGGPTKWANGYNLYYNAMKNRIVEFLAIPTDSEEGLLTLKHWLDNHLRGDEVGGLANFYSTHVPNSSDMLYQLPEGTPHAGEWIVPALKSNVNHGQTIVGYNDSICWDFNGDGLYTNDRDINGDGVINIHDWEVGAVIFCNSFGTAFANQGYCYLPYRRLAELPAAGGIWNKCVYVVNVKDPVTPRLTYKVTMSHTCRNRIKLQAGVASNLQASEPEHTIDWGVFNFQGGEWYMQGDSTEAGKTLEFGLDVSRLLEFINPNEPAKFFLQVVENDPDGVANGTVASFALLDYNGVIPTTTACAQQNVPIANNSTTTLSLTYGVNFTRPRMAPAPPVMEAFSDYQYQIPVSGGQSPYRFEFTKEYEVGEFEGDFPGMQGTVVSLSNNDNGYAQVSIPFEFPFYDETYDNLCIYADGYITFRHNTYDWPFLQNAAQQVRSTQMIAPFRADLVVSSVRVQKSLDKVDVAVSARVGYQQSSTLNYVVRLYPDGVVEYYYGSMDFTGSDFLSLLSPGDTRIWQNTPVSGVSAAEIANRNFRFTPPQRADFLTLSREGLLQGSSQVAFTNLPVAITCFDINDQRHDTLLYLSCEYGNMLLLTDITVSAGGNGVIAPGEEVSLSFTVRNQDSVPYNDCRVRFTSASPYVEMLDDEEYFGYIGGGNAYTLNHAIRFRVSEDAPNLTLLDFVATITNESYPMSQQMSFVVHTCDLVVDNYALEDGNDGLIGADEEDLLRVWFRNAGGEELANLHFQLRALDPTINITGGAADLETLAVGDVAPVEFTFHPTAAFGGADVVDLFVDVFIGGHFTETKVIRFLNLSNCEGFEGSLPECFSMADTAWSLCDTVVYDGNYTLQSGLISHNDTSTVKCVRNILREGNVSFWFKTSTENNYDWLCFYIDGVRQNRWSGIHDWTQTSYPVLPGEHTFEWKYIKDYSVNGNEDKVWIDDVCFPLDNDAQPQLEISPAQVSVMAGADSVVVPLLFESVTPIYLLFDNRVQNADGQSIGWASIEYASGSLSALASREMNLVIRMAGLPDGVYRAFLVAEVAGGNTVTVPIEVFAQGTGVAEYVTEEMNIRVYPNPTSGETHVEVEGEPQRMLCRLFDLSGRLLNSLQVVDSHFVVDLQDKPSGFYFLQLTAEGRTPRVVKIVKR